MGGGRPCNCTGGRRQLGRRQWWGRRRSCRARVGGRRRAAARPTGGGGLRDECQASRLQKIYSIPQPRSAAPKHSDPGCGVGPRGETAHTHTAHRSTHTHSTRQTHHNSTHTHNTTQHTAHITHHTHNTHAQHTQTQPHTHTPHYAHTHRHTHSLSHHLDTCAGIRHKTLHPQEASRV